MYQPHPLSPVCGRSNLDGLMRRIILIFVVLLMAGCPSPPARSGSLYFINGDVVHCHNLRVMQDGLSFRFNCDGVDYIGGVMRYEGGASY